MWQTYLTVALVAYLLGSIPFGYILVKLFLKQDIRTTGSGNIGATNVARSGKKGLAIATLLLDAGKGLAAVAFAHHLYFAMAGGDASIAGREHFRVFAACMSIIGHIFPVWLDFKGGKGVATGVGAFFAVNPFAVGIAFAAFLVTLAITRFVSLSSILASIVFAISATVFIPFFTAWETRLLCIAAAALIVLKHHSNIRRLLNGTEPKFGVKKAIPTDPIQVEKNA